ncbi:MAG: hypothetical protein GY862_36710 [Gammaproteobacteria bacterium]|nr:hypothetical protein [Gammaproteobacteria bacterium]
MSIQKWKYKQTSKTVLTFHMHPVIPANAGIQRFCPDCDLLKDLWSATYPSAVSIAFIGGVPVNAMINVTWKESFNRLHWRGTYTTTFGDGRLYLCFNRLHWRGTCQHYTYHGLAAGFQSPSLVGYLSTLSKKNFLILSEKLQAFFAAPFWCKKVGSSRQSGEEALKIPFYPSKTAIPMKREWQVSPDCRDEPKS